MIDLIKKVTHVGSLSAEKRKKDLIKTGMIKMGLLRRKFSPTIEDIIYYEGKQFLFKIGYPGG